MAIDPREEDAVRGVMERLKSTYGKTHTSDQIEAAVSAAHALFDDRPVRDFVPVLVERKARAMLKEVSD